MREPLLSFAGTLFSLYIVESITDFFRALRLWELANIVNLNRLALSFYGAFLSRAPLRVLIESGALYTLVLYISFSVICLILSLIVFRRMDLD